MAQKIDIDGLIKFLTESKGITQREMYETLKISRGQFQAWRTFATNAALAGIPLQELKKFTGHKSLTSLAIYLRNSEIEAAVKYAKHPFFDC